MNEADSLKPGPSEPDADLNPEPPKNTASRKSFQVGRRLFHMSMGTVVALAYWAFFSHMEAVYILGAIACLIYIFEQIRINYPALTERFSSVFNYLLRAEEQLKESAAIPYIMGILLTILTFPKITAVVAILTLAIADPLSALVGIKFGKTHVVKDKSIEGSMAFFLACFFCTLTVFLVGTGGEDLDIWVLAFLVAISVTIFEMIPIRIDDNLTIPLFTAAITSFYTHSLGIPLGIPM